MQALRPRRKLACAALCYGAGVWVGAALPATPWLFAGVLLGVLLLVALRAAGRRLFPGAMALFALCGLVNAAYCAHPALPPAGEYAVTATVAGEVSAREDGRLRATLKNVTCTDASGNVYRVSGAYWTYWPKADDARVPLDGQTARFTGNLYLPRGQANPGGFDFRLYLLTQGIPCGISGAKELALSPGGQTAPASPFLRARGALDTRLDALLGAESPLAKALLTGTREDMPEDMRQSYRDAGVAHILSISGLHAMLLFTALAFVLGRLAPSPRLMLLLMSAAMLLYCALVGFTAAVVRACVMMFCLLLSRCARRRTDGVTQLSAAFLIVLIARPLALFSAGFQMSFCAVLGIYTLGDRARACVRRLRLHPLVRRLLEAFLVTLSANIAVALPTIYAYNRLSLIGLAINPLACAAAEGLMLAYIALLLLSLVFPAGAALLGRALGAATAQFNALVRAAGEMPLAAVNVPSPPWYVALAVVLCLVLCTRFVIMRPLRRLLLGGGALLLSLLIALCALPRDVRYTQLSMGSADCAIIEDGGQTVVIDCGEYGGDAASYLLAAGRRADTVILTHLHADHALGLNALLDAHVAIGRILLPASAREDTAAPLCLAALERAQAAGIPIARLQAGDTLQTPRVRMRVLWPEAGAGRGSDNANDTALALFINLDGVTLLHMSDVPGAYESYIARRADLLLCAHHGSNSSTYAPLLSVAQPDVALISSSAPGAKTLQRLAQAGIMVYDTDTRGALTVTVRRGGYAVRGYLW